MTKIDWAQVAREYNASKLDISDITSYARKAAKLLAQQKVPYDGYIDEVANCVEQRREELEETQNSHKQNTGILRFIFKKPAGSANSKHRYQHVGFWSFLEEKETSGGMETRRESWTSKDIEESHSVCSTTTYALLAEGELWRFHTHEYTRQLWNRVVDVEVTGEWRQLDEEDILLLDHQLRRDSREQPYNRRKKEYWYYEAKILSKDNYIITGKKGGGCRKLLTKLLEHNGIKPPPRRKKPHTSRRSRPHQISKPASYQK